VALSHASAHREVGGEALTGGMQAWLLISEITLSGADLVTWWGRQYRALRYRERRHGPAEPETQSMHANSLHGNRDIPGVADYYP
jgi:hypothetical protein